VVIIAITMGNKRLLFIFLIGLICCCGLANAAAVNFSMSDLGGLTAKQDVLCYLTDGTPCAVAQWNTSSVALPMPASDFILVIKPSAIGRLANPTTFLTDGFDWIETYWLQISLLLIVIAVFWKKR